MPSTVALESVRPGSRRGWNMPRQSVGCAFVVFVTVLVLEDGIIDDFRHGLTICKREIGLQVVGMRETVAQSVVMVA